LGGGRVARFVAEAMADTAQVKIIEQDLTRAERLSEVLPRALILHGDGTDLELLQAESIDQMDSFVAVTGDDEDNIIATLLAKQYNVKRPVVLVNNVDYLRILPSIGLNTAISKQMLTANAVLQFIQHRQLAAIASIPGIQGQLIEYIASRGSRITQKRIKDLRFPHGAVIGAIVRNGSLIIPDGSMRVEAGDRTVVFTLPGAISDLDRLFGN
jgi:trk system potassium uptake protein